MSKCYSWPYCCCCCYASASSIGWLRGRVRFWHGDGRPHNPHTDNHYSLHSATSPSRHSRIDDHRHRRRLTCRRRCCHCRGWPPQRNCPWRRSRRCSTDRQGRSPQGPPDDDGGARWKKAFGPPWSGVSTLNRHKNQKEKSQTSCIVLPIQAKI